MASKYQSIALSEDKTQNATHPVEKAGIFSRLIYGWATPLLSVGNERQLDPSDLWPLQDENQCKNVNAAFEPAFNKSRSLMWSICTTHGWRFLLIGLMQVSTVCCTLYGPVVLQQILTALELTAPFDLPGMLKLVASLCAVNVFQALVTSHSNLQNQLTAVKITSALQYLLFQKALVLGPSARRDKTAGEIANLFSNDIQWIMNFAIYANQLWLVPIQIVATMWMLYAVIGWATFVGFVVILLTLLANQVVGQCQHSAFEQLMERKDTRMKSINEVFGAMQILKLNAWEEKFGAKIERERNSELAALWKVFLYSGMSTTATYLGPVVVTVGSFMTYALVMHETLTATKVFTALTLFNLLKFPISDLPYIVTNLMQALVAVKRMMEFLDLPEKDTTIVSTPSTAPKETLDRYVNEKLDIALEDATFGWDASKPLFQNINLSIQRGEFVVVHGSVGEGKTSLCAALLGEMNKHSGSAFVGGRVAYFSQQSWIQHMTIRENILFGKPYDRVKYNNVIEACALTKDLTLFAAGDRTEIGQKGANLSGGQKARINLARACYSDADIYILDAPLSAVDAIVQNEIFTKCFLGLLRHKTIVLVTHSPEIVASQYIDRLIEIKDGQLVETKVASQKSEYPLLVQPLPARLGYSDDAELIADSARTTFSDDLLLTPSANSPLPAHFRPFTPLGEGNPTFDEQDESSGRLVLDETRSYGRVSSSVYAAYFQALGGWPIFLYWIVVLCIWQGLAIAGDLWLSNWSSSAVVVPPAEFVANTGLNLSIYGGLAIAGAIMTIFRTLSIYNSALAASRRLFDQMTNALMRAPMKFFDTNPLGRILNRYSNDMNTVDTTIPFCVSGLLGAITNAVFALGTTFWMIQYMGLIAVPLLYLYIAIGRYYIQPAREMERVNKTTKSPLLNLISETIEGGLVIRAYGDKQMRRFQRIHCRNVDANNEALYAAQVITQWFSLRMQLTSAAMLFLIASSLVLMREHLNAGLIGLALNYIFTLLSYFEWCVSVLSQLETSMVGPERISEYKNVEPEAPRVISGAVSKEWPTKGDIEFKNMGFRYKENDPLVLKDVNVHIQAGEKIGIVGRTGAGKSSLTMALFRINELATGCIKIDGVDISKIGVKTLRSAIAIIPQTPVLFKGPLRNYLDPFGEFTDDDLWSCLQKVNLVDRISSVNGKLDSPVEENGENFSVGERQMLCMARALLRQARIVVMDEATAAIDHETDQNLQRVIRTEFASSTVLTIAHRLDTVLDCDRILVFDQGRLAQCDAPKSLISQGRGIFFELYSEGGYLDKVLSVE
ncbi:unnamed protein product [Aphanomyces euteiches]